MRRILALFQDIILTFSHIGNILFFLYMAFPTIFDSSNSFEPIFFYTHFILYVSLVKIWRIYLLWNKLIFESRHFSNNNLNQPVKLLSCNMSKRHRCEINCLLEKNSLVLFDCGFRLRQNQCYSCSCCV